MCEAIEEMINA